MINPNGASNMGANGAALDYEYGPVSVLTRLTAAVTVPGMS